MYYEITVKYDDTNDNGKKIKQKTEKLLSGDILTFTEAESLGYSFLTNFNNTDVTNIKRSRIRELANSPESGNILYIAKLQSVFTEDTGKQKSMYYYIGVYAPDIDTAKIRTTEYLKQGYNGITLCGINETKMIPV